MSTIVTSDSCRVNKVLSNVRFWLSHKVYLCGDGAKGCKSGKSTHLLVFLVHYSNLSPTIELPTVILTTSSKPNIKRSAAFSRCKTYRYALTRQWQDSKPDQHVVFIGLNPSTADHRKDDPTIRRCMGFTRSWGYNNLTVINLFAFRTPYPEELKKVDDPVGPYNTKHLGRIISQADLVIACWGKDGAWLEQDKRLAKRYEGKLHCLAINKDGSPAHPLYQRADKTPEPWLSPWVF